jgi:hypothetical protein
MRVRLVRNGRERGSAEIYNASFPEALQCPHLHNNPSQKRRLPLCQPLTPLSTAHPSVNHSRLCQPLTPLSTTHPFVNHSPLCQPLPPLSTTPPCQPLPPCHPERSRGICSAPFPVTTLHKSDPSVHGTPGPAGRQKRESPLSLRFLSPGQAHYRSLRSVEKYFQERSAELQIPRLRSESVTLLAFSRFWPS